MRRTLSSQLKEPPNVLQHTLTVGEHGAQFIAVSGGRRRVHKADYSTISGNPRTVKNGAKSVFQTAKYRLGARNSISPCQECYNLKLPSVLER